MIVESGLVTATTADLLSSGRLNTIPYAGKLQFQIISNLADASNQYALTVQKPDGGVPIDGQLVPADQQGASGVLKTGEYMEFVWAAANGGHFTISLTETGTAVATWRAILTP